MQRKAVLYDKGGDQHYDYISAWIKSTRGSDPDASLYYLAAMLEGGEDARFIVRRMIVLASEDIGNADPRALEVAVATAAAVEHVGLPECQYALAQAAIYLSLAPKSNAAARAIGEARGHIPSAAPGCRRPRCARPRTRRREARPRGGLRVPARQPGHVNDQEHLPEGLEELRFYLRTRASPRCARPRRDPPRPRPPRLRPTTRRCLTVQRHGWDMDHGLIPVHLDVVSCWWDGHLATLSLACAARSRSPGGPHVRLRLARPVGLPPRQGAAGARGVPASDELDVLRLLAFDPARRHVLCAFAPLDGAETLMGLGAIDAGEDAPDVLVVDERLAGGLAELLGRVLVERARPRQPPSHARGAPVAPPPAVRRRPLACPAVPATLVSRSPATGEPLGSVEAATAASVRGLRGAPRRPRPCGRSCRRRRGPATCAGRRGPARRARRPRAPARARDGAAADGGGAGRAAPDGRGAQRARRRRAGRAGRPPPRPAGAAARRAGARSASSGRAA